MEQLDTKFGLGHQLLKIELCCSRIAGDSNVAAMRYWIAIIVWIAVRTGV
jgi:hypothetical protein